MARFICIHGHFYQPPRENPWLEEIEQQPGAAPYHDWNERITAECYQPNTEARILEERGHAVRVVNNFDSISFDFGPTLLSWLERKARATYDAILEADRRSRERFSGHGSALAQVYHHAIMPLCNERDRRTQVIWGLREFELRFGRKAEGIWLAETAVDLASLEVLAEQGVAFTLLAPRQARRVRKLGASRWTELRDGAIDPKRPYRIKLPSGRSLVLFFYDGPISQAVAFEGLLHDGGGFAARLMSGFNERRQEEQLVQIATDGESYGHHHQFGEMALAAALDRIREQGRARITNYGEFLARHPPAHEVEIHENSSWSCAHGVERWQSDCGCRAGRGKDWNQAWRGPLRAALDGLRDELAVRFERQAGAYLTAPFEARDRYVDVVTLRTEQALERFFQECAARPLGKPEQQTVLELMELQRHALYMYTSCGWFFDDPTGLETRQILAYAGRALDLAARRFPDDLEGPFLRRLEQAVCNPPGAGTARTVYEEEVRARKIGLEEVALRAGFSKDKRPPRYGCFRIEWERELEETVQGRTLICGQVLVTSELTRESRPILFAGVCLENGRRWGGTRAGADPEQYERLVAALRRILPEGGADDLLAALAANLDRARAIA